jgi:hypothetical protein
LMPSAKTGTVVKDVSASVQDMVGASEYRERLGVIRMAIGQLGMTPEELSRNIRSFIENVKKDMAGMSDRIAKDIHEVVSYNDILHPFLQTGRVLEELWLTYHRSSPQPTDLVSV